MYKTISELKRSGDPHLCTLIAIMKRSNELTAEDDTMNATEAQQFLRIDSNKWNDYRRESIVLPYVNLHSAGVVYKRADLERLLKETSCPNNN
jgi:predicted transcriptional regulator